MVQLMLLPSQNPTSLFLIQTGFTFLVLAYPGLPRTEAVKPVCRSVFSVLKMTFWGSEVTEVFVAVTCLLLSDNIVARCQVIKQEVMVTVTTDLR